MKGWIKYFLDGTTEEGSDNTVQHGRASWSRGRLEGMTRVRISNGRYRMEIHSPGGRFHQSDDYRAPLFGVHPTVTARRIQCQLKNSDLVMVVRTSPVSLSVQLCPSVTEIAKPLVDERYEIIEVPKNSGSKWLTLEMDLADSEMRMRITEKAI